MKKVAIMVEGQTERIFCEQFLFAVAGYERGLVVLRRRLHGGYLIDLGPRGGDPSDATITILLISCESGDKVLSYIAETVDRLTRDGFSKVVGLKDLHPQKREDVPKLMQTLALVQKTSRIPIELVLATMEIEAWFLADADLLPQISAHLTEDQVCKILGVANLDEIQVEELARPAVLLDELMKGTGERYTKAEAQIHSIVSKLNMENLYLVKAAGIPSFQKFVRILDCVLG